MENIWRDAVKDTAENMPKLCDILGRNDAYYHNKWHQDGYIDFVSILGCVRSNFWDNWNNCWKTPSDEDIKILEWGVKQQKDQLASMTHDVYRQELTIQELLTGKDEKTLRAEYAKQKVADAIELVYEDIEELSRKLEEDIYYGDAKDDGKTLDKYAALLRCAARLKKMYNK